VPSLVAASATGTHYLLAEEGQMIGFIITLLIIGAIAVSTP